MRFKSKREPSEPATPCGSERIVSLAPITLTTLVCALPKGHKNAAHFQSEERDDVSIGYTWHPLPTQRGAGL